MQPIDPDEINDILNDPNNRELGSGNEQAEADLFTALKEAQRALGPEAYQEAVIKLLLQHEPMLRRDHPDHPGLATLDEWRRLGGANRA